MKNLEGKTILVGKEPNSNRLLLSVEVNGVMKTTALDMNVPNSVSRCIPEQGTAHCKIEVQDPNNIIIHNTKAKNVTFVNHQQIENMHIQRNSNVQLGHQHFSLDVDKVLTSAIQLVKPIVPPIKPETPIQNTVNPAKPQTQASNQKMAYSLAHLEPVWKKYEEGLEEAKEQKKKAMKKKNIIMRCVNYGFPGLAIAFIFGGGDPTVVKAVCSLIFTVIAVWLGHNLADRIKDPSEEMKKELEEYLDQNYVCPHAGCGIPFGKGQPFSKICHLKKCGNCGGPYINNITVEEAEN